MNQKELITKISTLSGISQANTKTVLDTMKTVVSQELQDGGTINLHNFGTFKTSFVQEREQMLGKYDVPAHVAPRFVYSPNVKKALK